MGLYDDQIQTRIRNDNDAFDESLFRLASVVTGDKSRVEYFLSDREKAQDAIGEILKHFNIAQVTLPPEIHEVEEQLEYLLRPSGVMRRRVELTGNWYKDGAGPLIGQMKDGKVIALLPAPFSGYTFFDYGVNKYVKVTRKIAEQIEIDAICFYKPLPLHKLGIYDLLKHMVSSLSVSDMVMIAASMFAASLLGLITPYATKQLFSNVVVSGQTFQLLSLAVLMLGAVFSTALINITSEVIIARISTKTDISVQSAAMMRVLSLPASFFKDYSAGDLSQRLQSLNQVCGQTLGIVIRTVLSTIFSFIYMGQIAVFAPVLVQPSLIVIVVGLLFALASTVTATKVTHEQMKESAKLSGLVFALYSGVQKIRLAGCELRAFAKWANAYEKMAKWKFTPPFLVRVSPVISSAITAIGAVFIFSVAGQHQVSVSNYMAFSSSFGQISSAILTLTGILTLFASVKPVFEMVKPILNAEPETAVGKKMITRLSGGIEVNSVSFRYNEDTPPVLDNISLKIRSGQYVAIVGASGCGKSTLLRLLLGFEQANRGAIYYDSRNINEVDPNSLRRHIGCVIQDGKLMSGDIFSNITVSAPMLTLNDAWGAAELAGIADDIRAMPMGMNTIVAEGGGGLSGGQKQRLMIARAIASKPKILMLDEATSALDNITQKHVSESLEGLKCTRLVIAHRLSTIRHCNRIIFLEKGKIVEDGTYEELITLGGKFKELVERQRLEQGAV